MPKESSPMSTRTIGYGTAKDLPSYQELSQSIQGGKLLTFIFARDQRRKILEIKQQLNRLTKIVDDFYMRLGPRNWIFHDQLNTTKIEALLAETSNPQDAEARLIELYTSEGEITFWIMRLYSHEGLRTRIRQIERARQHY